MNYYNEHDPKTAAWLRELIERGLIPNGVVDERSITEVKAEDISGFMQCHWFCGIAGWSLALQLAGWPATRPVWTGSCPCQPFSSAGKQLGTADERHLWPVFFDLIRECRPPTVIGEQVASPAALQWLDGVFADMEGEDYACGASDLCAAGVGAPHIRQRLFWVADATSPSGPEQFNESRRGTRRGPSSHHSAEHPGLGGGLVNPDRAGPQPGHAAAEADRHGRPVVADGGDGGLGHSFQSRLEGHAGHGDHGHQSGRLNTDAPRSVATAGRDCWSRFDLIPCADGKARRIEPGLAPLAHGVPARVVRLRGYGNAIVPSVAAEFVKAAIESLIEQSV